MSLTRLSRPSACCIGAKWASIRSSWSRWATKDASTRSPRLQILWWTPWRSWSIRLVIVESWVSIKGPRSWTFSMIDGKLCWIEHIDDLIVVVSDWSAAMPLSRTSDIPLWSRTISWTSDNTFLTHSSEFTSRPWNWYTYISNDCNAICSMVLTLRSLVSSLIIVDRWNGYASFFLPSAMVALSDVDGIGTRRCPTPWRKSCRALNSASHHCRQDTTETTEDWCWTAVLLRPFSIAPRLSLSRLAWHRTLSSSSCRLWTASRYSLMPLYTWIPNESRPAVVLTMLRGSAMPSFSQG